MVKFMYATEISITKLASHKLIPFCEFRFPSQ